MKSYESMGKEFCQTPALAIKRVERGRETEQLVFIREKKRNFRSGYTEKNQKDTINK